MFVTICLVYVNIIIKDWQTSITCLLMTVPVCPNIPPISCLPTISSWWLTNSLHHCLWHTWHIYISLCLALICSYHSVCLSVSSYDVEYYELSCETESLFFDLESAVVKLTILLICGVMDGSWHESCSFAMWELK